MERRSSADKCLVYEDKFGKALCLISKVPYSRRERQGREKIKAHLEPTPNK